MRKILLLLSILFLLSFSYSAISCSSKFENVPNCAGYSICSCAKETYQDTCFVDKCIKETTVNNCQLDTNSYKCEKVLKDCKCIEYYKTTCYITNKCAYKKQVDCKIQKCIGWKPWEYCWWTDGKCDRCVKTKTPYECDSTQCKKEECKEDTQCTGEPKTNCFLDTMCIETKKVEESCSKTREICTAKIETCVENLPPEIIVNFSIKEKPEYNDYLYIPIQVKYLNGNTKLTLDYGRTDSKIFTEKDEIKITLEIPVIKTGDFRVTLKAEDLTDGDATLKEIFYAYIDTPSSPMPELDYREPFLAEKTEKSQFDLITGAFMNLTNVGLGVYQDISLFLNLFNPADLIENIPSILLLFIFGAIMGWISGITLSGIAVGVLINTLVPILLDVLPLIFAFFEKDKEKLNKLSQEFWGNVLGDIIISNLGGLVGILLKKIFSKKIFTLFKISKSDEINLKSKGFSKLANKIKKSKIFYYLNQLTKKSINHVDKIFEKSDDFVKKLNKDLAKKGIDIEIKKIVFDSKMRATGMADPDTGILYLNPKIISGTKDMDSSIINTIAHEVFHVVQFPNGKKAYFFFKDEPFEMNKIKKYIKNFESTLNNQYESKKGLSYVFNEFLDLSLNKVYVDKKNKMIKSVKFKKDVINGYNEYLESIEKIMNNPLLSDAEKISGIIDEFENGKEVIPKLAEMNVFSKYLKNDEFFDKSEKVITKLSLLSENNKNSKIFNNYLEDLKQITKFYGENIKEVKFDG